MKQTNYLLTGSSGFLGSIIARSIEGNDTKVKDINALTKRDIDITVPFDLPSDFIGDVVVHIAGRAHVYPKNKEEEEVFYKVNYEGTQNLCKALETANILPKTLVLISTVAVYGRETGEDLTEDTSLDGDTPYAKSKIMAEEYLRDWGEEHGVAILIFRLPLIAGPGAPGNLGKMVAGIKTGKYLSINKGKARRSIVLAEDIARCITDNIGKEGTYNLTDGYHPSFRELEAVISKQVGKGQPISLPVVLGKGLGKLGDILPGFPVNSDTISKMSNDLTFNSDKASRELNWKPRNVLTHFKI